MNASDCTASQSLLAVDLGLKTGFALFGGDGRLRWYRSHHLANSAMLRKVVYRTLRETEGLAWIYVEGGGNLGDVWEKEAEKQGVAIRRIGAEVWREKLLYAREQRSGKQAKQKADTLARRVIEWSNAPRPTSLRHDVSEAILIGLCGVLDVGWVQELPSELRG